MATLEEIGKLLNQTLDEKLGLGEGRNVNLFRMERQLNNLHVLSPEAVARDRARSVVGMGSRAQAEAVRKGAVATWTFIKSEEKAMAVSCAHCAFPFDVQGRAHDLEFVEIPQELIGHVVSVGHLPVHLTSNRVRTSDDIAYLLLRSFPGNINRDAVPLWDIPGEEAFSSYPNVAGLALSGAVRGNTCTYRGEGASARFVEETGEEGNSGALMQCVASDGLDPVIIGVYVGTARRRSGLRVRGEICLLRDLNEFAECPPKPSPPLRFRMKDKGEKDKDKHYHEYVAVGDEPFTFRKSASGKKIFGFFIPKTDGGSVAAAASSSSSVTAATTTMQPSPPHKK